MLADTQPKQMSSGFKSPPAPADMRKYGKKRKSASTGKSARGPLHETTGPFTLNQCPRATMVRPLSVANQYGSLWAESDNFSLENPCKHRTRTFV